MKTHKLIHKLKLEGYDTSQLDAVREAIRIGINKEDIDVYVRKNLTGRDMKAFFSAVKENILPKAWLRKLSEMSFEQPDKRPWRGIDPDSKFTCYWHICLMTRFHNRQATFDDFIAHVTLQKLEQL